MNKRICSLTVSILSLLLLGFSAYASSLTDNVKFIEVDLYMMDNPVCEGESDIIYNDFIASLPDYGLDAFYNTACDEPREPWESAEASAGMMVFPVEENADMEGYLAYVKTVNGHYPYYDYDGIYIYEEDPIDITVDITTYYETSSSDKDLISKTSGQIEITDYEGFNATLKEINALDSSPESHLAFTEKFLSAQEFRKLKKAMNDSNLIHYTFAIYSPTYPEISPELEMELHDLPMQNVSELFK